jgi:hypothetical protein
VVFGAYAEAGAAVALGAVDAFASVSWAHRAHLSCGDVHGFKVVDVPEREKIAERGAFAFAIEETKLRDAVDEILDGYLGSVAHRAMMARCDFSAEVVERVASGC